MVIDLVTHLASYYTKICLWGFLVHDDLANRCPDCYESCDYHVDLYLTDCLVGASPLDLVTPLVGPQ